MEVETAAVYRGYGLLMPWVMPWQADTATVADESLTLTHLIRRVLAMLQWLGRTGASSCSTATVSSQLRSYYLPELLTSTTTQACMILSFFPSRTVYRLHARAAAPRAMHSPNRPRTWDHGGWVAFNYTHGPQAIHTHEYTTRAAM